MANTIFGCLAMMGQQEGSQPKLFCYQINLKEKEKDKDKEIRRWRTRNSSESGVGSQR
jgi:hypothetical protein